MYDLSLHIFWLMSVILGNGLETATLSEQQQHRLQGFENKHTRGVAVVKAVDRRRMKKRRWN